MNLKDMRLQLKMILAGVMGVIIFFLIAGVIIYIKFSLSLQTITKKNSSAIAVNLSNHIRYYLTQELDLVNSLSADPVIKNSLTTRHFNKTEEKLESLYKIMIRDYISFFVTDKNGTIMAYGSGIKSGIINISDREYFRSAKAGKATISSPIISKITGNLVIIVSAPVTVQDRFQGLIASVIDIQSIAKKAFTVNLGNTGYSFIVNNSGLVLIHPESDLILKSNINTIKSMEVIAGKIRNRESGAESYLYGGEEKIAAFAPIEGTDWNIIVTQNKNEILAPAKSVYIFIFISALIVLVFTIGGIIYLSIKISSPVQKMIDIFRQLTINSSEIVIHIGPDKKIEFVNSAYEKLLSIKAADVIGFKPDLTNKNNIPEENIWKVLENGNSWSGQIIMKDKNDDPLTLEVIIIPIYDNRGSVYGFVEIGRNITSELLAERRFREAQKIEAIGVMAGGIAHDINNILAGIFGYVELSLSVNGNPEKTDKYIREVLKAAERARDLVSQILTFSRQNEYGKTAVIPKYIVKEALQLLRVSTPASIDIRSDLKTEAAVMAEPTQLHQIIINLCINAVYSMKNMNSGVLEITLGEFHADKDFTAKHPGISEGRHIILKISDTGEGIEKSDLDHIFEPFFTTKPKGEGTGLGLSVAHGIIRSMSGIITVYSDIGKGTVFNVIIPVTEIETSSMNNIVPDISGGDERILLIDDEEPIIDSIETILSNIGYRVTSFRKSREALNEILSNSAGYDLIITDYSMPEMTGLELIRELNKNNIKIPVILSSGYISKTLEVEMENENVSGLMKKPVSTVEMTEVIRKIFGKSG